MTASFIQVERKLTLKIKIFKVKEVEKIHLVKEIPVMCGEKMGQISYI